MNYRFARKRLVNWIASQLTGPASSAEILVGAHPAERYPVGFLSPLADPDDFIDEDTITDNVAEVAQSHTGGEAPEDATVEVAKSAVQQRRFAPPSSAGFSFYLLGSESGCGFQIMASAARYRNITGRTADGRFGALQYERHNLVLPQDSLSFNLPDAVRHNRTRHVAEAIVFDERARLSVVWRPHGDGWIVTVSLSNRQTFSSLQQTGNSHAGSIGAGNRHETTLFEVALRVVIDEGIVGDYPRVDFALLSNEERELEFQYQHRKIHAVGHGTAVDWEVRDSCVREIWLDFVPTVEVPQLTADTVVDTSGALNLAWLVDDDGDTVISQKVLDSLSAFTDGYEDWVEQQQGAVAVVTTGAAARQPETAAKIVDRMQVTLARMRSGIRLLGASVTAARSFRIANAAMLMQMLQHSRNAGKRANPSEVNWRPFQLAFLLTVIDSAVSQEDPFRDTVDLIWFPTGGGKTEAYLALIAFVLAYRRLDNRAQSGANINGGQNSDDQNSDDQSSSGQRVSDQNSSHENIDDVNAGNQGSGDQSNGGQGSSQGLGGQGSRQGLGSQGLGGQRLGGQSLGGQSLGGQSLGGQSLGGNCSDDKDAGGAEPCGGTAVIMRYTLRLLTTQQFLRACKMICALELVRRADRSLGSEPFSCGLWVGGAASPNHYSDALEVVALIASGNAGARKRLVFDCCPWCESEFGARNYIASDTSFAFHCYNADCDFGATDNKPLPCNVVDEALYGKPPSMLLATIDKFARMVWDERSGVFLGAGRYLPPELIVQDELHLVAGALGSVAGLYEAALDSALLELGMRAKYVASTATIRMAGEQVERLYGRSLAVFPPPGLSADDSYFARTVAVEDRPGRLYAGFLAPLLGSNNCMVPLVAAIMQAPQSVFGEGEIDREELLEAWWTLVVYHGSLKGVGNSHNNFSAAIRDSMARLIIEYDNKARDNPSVEAQSQDGFTDQPGADIAQLDNSNANTNNSAAKRDTITRAMPETGNTRRKPSTVGRGALRVAQLTSQSSAEQNATTFNQLANTRAQGDYLDAVLATNMISVGLDVSRLALMVINGQPLTTAEYIQTSSRVGRGDVPGIVFTNYYRSQARSLSHYENFRAYHESFYRFVEPTSVTPYTHQARQRALHTALVMVVRHVCPGLLANTAAGQFDLQNPAVQSVLARLKKRCAAADPARAAEIAGAIDTLAVQWADHAARSALEKVQLNYSAPNSDIVARRLLHSYEDETSAAVASRGLWPALNSMRNVEKSALLKADSIRAKR